MSLFKRTVGIFLTLLMIAGVLGAAPLSVDAQSIKQTLTGDAVTDGQTGDCFWKYDESTHSLSISGNGYMGSYPRIAPIDYCAGMDFDCYYYDEEPWSPFKGKIETVIIGEGVLNVGICAFVGYEEIKKVVLPESLLAIEEYAFRDCRKLADINIPENVKYIYNCAFQSCESLEEFFVPKNVTTFSFDVLFGCKNLKNVSVDENNKNFVSIDGNVYSKDRHYFDLFTGQKGQKLYCPRLCKNN